jgi:arylsulfatase A-like enzyme
LIRRREFLWTPLALAAGLPGQTPPRRPNVILIVAGLWRAQAVPWAGDTDVDAPNLAKLARQSLVFTRAYASCARAYRALPCLLRGVFPHTLLGNDDHIETLAAEAPSLRPVLRKAGYRVAAFAARQAEDIVSFMHAPAEQPFYAEWTFDDSAGGLIGRRDSVSLHLRANVPEYAEAKAREDLSLFYARAAARDREIGTVLEALDQPGSPLVENTIVIFTSLHGEQFGSHGETGDDSAFEETIRIPLLIRYPRAIPHAGASDILASQADLAPTLLKWCGAAIPETAQGRDLSGLLTSQPVAEDARPDAVYAEGLLGQKDEWRMLVQGYDKLVTDLEGNATHLYNLADDPAENTNLATASSYRLRRDVLLAQQKVWMKRLEDGVDASGLKKR